MFNQKVYRPACFPRELMDKVCVQKLVSAGLDDTLIMTAVMLLYNRVNDLKISYNISNKDDVDSISQNPNVYSFRWFEGIDHNPDEFIKSIKNDFKSIEKLPTHEKFLSDQLKQPVFIRLMPHENTVCIFTTKVTLPVWHCVPFFIPKFFPIFKEKPITKEETTFLESLTLKTSGHYTERLTELTHSESFRTFVLKDQLQKFERKLFESKINKAKENLANIDNQMERAMQTYKEACNKRIEAVALVAGLETMTGQIDEHTELQDYLLNNKRITNVMLDGSYISFIAKTYLAPHHIEEWETISRHNRIFSVFTTSASPNSPFQDKDNIKLLLNSILSEDRCLKLKMCAYFRMDYFGSEVRSEVRHNFASDDIDLKNYIGNPHLNYHNCFGQNKLAIVDQLRNGDAIGAIECAIACTQRMNINESATFDPFVRELLSFKGKCLVAEDGTEMTPVEALEYLKGKKDE